LFSQFLGYELAEYGAVRLRIRVRVGHTAINQADDVFDKFVGCERLPLRLFGVSVCQFEQLGEVIIYRKAGGGGLRDDGLNNLWRYLLFLKEKLRYWRQ
jgi:hypothetical protein